MNTLLFNKCIKSIMIISFIFFAFSSLYAQDIQSKAEKDKDVKMSELVERISLLKSKAEKLKLIVSANKNFSMNENMKGMHAKNKVIEITDEFSLVANSLWNITSILNNILSSSEVINNEETRENFSTLSLNLATIIAGSENFLTNIELYQKILIEHNMDNEKSKQK